MDLHANLFVNEIKEKLLKEKEETKIRLQGTQYDLDHTTLIDEVDIASQHQQNIFRHQLKTRDQLYLKKIDIALKKIEKSEYGYCRICEELIPENRLRARPTADTHVDCKENEEITEKQMFGIRSTSAKLSYGE